MQYSIRVTKFKDTVFLITVINLKLLYVCTSKLVIVGFGHLGANTGFLELASTEENVNLGKYVVQTQMTAILPNQTVKRAQRIILSSNKETAYTFLNVTSLGNKYLYFGYPNASYVSVSGVDCVKLRKIGTGKLVDIYGLDTKTKCTCRQDLEYTFGWARRRIYTTGQFDVNRWKIHGSAFRKCLNEQNYACQNPYPFSNSHFHGKQTNLFL